MFFLLPTPALATWPTTSWHIKEEAQTLGIHTEPSGERAAIARKHKAVLEKASLWYAGLGFPQPVAERGFDGKFIGYLKTDTSDIGSQAISDGTIKLTSHPGFIKLDTPMWELMEHSAVHEIFHSIQYSYKPFLTYVRKQNPGSTACRNSPTIDDWITEGTASYIQIRWAELEKGIRYGHPFKGSTRPAWVRHFDQRLDWGSTPADLVEYDFNKMTHLDANEYDWRKDETYSWQCSYGTWYFWYAAGEMLAGMNTHHRVAYLQHIFKQSGPWEDTGVAMVDAGLRQAAGAMNSLEAYRHGLYSIYPEFVAQYLDGPAFYEKVADVELGTPGLYETRSDATSGGDNGVLQRLASRAWRVRVQLPEGTDWRTTVRFTLDAQDGTDRDQLHLIVDDKLARRPVNRNTPYTLAVQVRNSSAAGPQPTEFLVRVANVARDAAATEPAAYRLKIEVEGYYGDISTDVVTPFDPESDAAAVAGELPPGFHIRGPDASWTCLGDSNARAQFAVITPDNLADSVERGTEETVLGAGADFDDIMKQLQSMQQRGVDMGVDLGALQQEMQQAQQKVREVMEEVRPELERGAAEAAAAARARQTSLLQAAFASSEGDCQMNVNVQWPGHEGGHAMIITEPLTDGDHATFAIHVQRKEKLLEIAGLAGLSTQDLATIQARTEALREPFVWLPRSCREVLSSCPAAQCNPGRLRLEEVTPTRLVGTFDFEVVKRYSDPPPDDPTASCEEREAHNEVQTVSGYFSATSTIEDARTVFDVFLPGRTGAQIPGMLLWDPDHDDED